MVCIALVPSGLGTAQAVGAFVASRWGGAHRAAASGAHHEIQRRTLDESLRFPSQGVGGVAVLAFVLAASGCGGGKQQVAQPTATTSAPTVTEPPPTTRKATPTTAAPARNCDPAYPDACLHDGIGDYDCAGGSGNGPNYVRGPIRVRPPDPFDLDRNGDGVGCEG